MNNSLEVVISCSLEKNIVCIDLWAVVSAIYVTILAEGAAGAYIVRQRKCVCSPQRNRLDVLQLCLQRKCVSVCVCV